MSTKSEAVRLFLSQEKFIVIEPSAVFGQNIINCLIELGVQPENAMHVKKYDEALLWIEAEKPKAILTEYFIQNKFGLSLIEKQSEVVEDSTRVSILITHNTSASAIAEAAEEQVDAYILKPFSMGELKEKIFSVIEKKVSPTQYVQKIRSGKRLLRGKEFALAEKEFMDAKQLNERPALAHYYVGHIQFLKKQFLEAEKEFQAGLQLQPLHYKCLLGEFDSLFEQKRYQDAYQLVPTITKHFPISPRRLGNIFIAAVFSYNLDDIVTYYDLFLRLDHRPPELVQIFSAALQTAGKFFVKGKKLDKALECFEMGISVAGPDIKYIDSIIRELLKLNAAKEALGFLAKFPGDQVGKKEHSQLSFLIDSHLLTDHQVIEKGKKLVAQGYADVESFRCLVKVLIDQKKVTLAEDIVNKAVSAYPDLRSEFYSLIEEK